MTARCGDVKNTVLRPFNEPIHTLAQSVRPDQHSDTAQSGLDAVEVLATVPTELGLRPVADRVCQTFGRGYRVDVGLVEVRTLGRWTRVPVAVRK